MGLCLKIVYGLVDSDVDRVLNRSIDFGIFRLTFRRVAFFFINSDAKKNPNNFPTHRIIDSTLLSIFIAFVHSIQENM